jgi:hypothetical protein
MFYAQLPFYRSACFLAAAAVTLATISTSQAQQAASRSAVNVAAVGQVNAPPVLNADHPDTYVVQRDDTLWDIAAMFLRDPWYWPEIWQINPQVANPHLIYPGDILSLAYLGDGRPVLQLERGSGTVERLSPRVRSEPLEQAIPTIPFETLRAFLSRPTVLNGDDLDRLPYVFANPEGLMSSAGREVYVRGTEAQAGAVFNMVHVGNPLIDPDDNSVIGYEGQYVGQGRLRRGGDPATLSITESTRETLIGDYLIEEESITPINFVPRAPESQVEGRIISVVDGVSLIGQYQVVVINRGARDGLEPGHVMQVLKTGEEVVDRSNKRFFGEKVRLPDEPAGTMMVFRIFDRMSYALVMEATRAIAVLDTVRNP